MKNSRRQQKATVRKRRGFVSMELVLTLPILATILTGMVEFSLLFYARSSLMEANRIGARTATLMGVDQTQVENEIRKVLNPRLQQQLEVECTPGVRSGDTVVVAIRVPMTAASPDLLWPIGYSLNGRYLYAETRMIKE